MKNKKYSVFLFVEGLILIVIGNTLDVKSENIFDAFALPFTALSEMLGNLSLSSKTGNAVALIIYFAVCLIPIFVLIFKLIKKSAEKTDSILILLSAVLFAVIYLMINPSELGLIGRAENIGEILSTCILSVLCGYLILKFISFIEKDGGMKIEKYLKAIIMSIGAVFIFYVCFVSFGELCSALEKSEGFIETFMALFSFFNRTIPDLFAIAIVVYALEMLSEMSKDKYSEDTLKSSEKLSVLCFTAVKVSILISIIYNILQLRYITLLQNIKFSANIPLLSLCFILAMLVLSRYMKDSKALKDDNDSFI